MPISRTDFENGSVFSHKGRKPYLFLVDNEGITYLRNDYDKIFYCRVSEVSQLGFTAGRLFFDEKIEVRVNFSDCEKIDQ